MWPLPLSDCRTRERLRPRHRRLCWRSPSLQLTVLPCAPESKRGKSARDGGRRVWEPERFCSLQLERGLGHPEGILGGIAMAAWGIALSLSLYCRVR